MFDPTSEGKEGSDDRKIRPPTDAYGAIGTNHNFVGRGGDNA
jgi:hypothetical protein